LFFKNLIKPKEDIKLKSFKKLALFFIDNKPILYAFIIMLWIAMVMTTNYLKANSFLSITMIFVVIIVVAACLIVISNHVVFIQKRTIDRKGLKLLLIEVVKLTDGSYHIVMPGHAIWGKAVEEVCFLIPYDLRKNKEGSFYYTSKNLMIRYNFDDTYILFVLAIILHQSFDAKELYNLYKSLEPQKNTEQDEIDKKLFSGKALNIAAYIDQAIMFDSNKKKEAQTLIKDKNLEIPGGKLSLIKDLSNLIIYSGVLSNIQPKVDLPASLKNNICTLVSYKENK